MRGAGGVKRWIEIDGVEIRGAGGAAMRGTVTAGAELEPRRSCAAADVTRAGEMRTKAASTPKPFARMTELHVARTAAPGATTLHGGSEDALMRINSTVRPNYLFRCSTPARPLRRRRDAASSSPASTRRATTPTGR
jgi:hypothetical protein